MHIRCINGSTAGKLIALALAAMLAFSGCARRAVEETPAPEVTPRPTPTPNVPVQGGTLALPILSQGDQGNPLLAATREMSSLYWLVFESLIKLDKNGAPQGYVAESWSVDETGLIWSFKMRDNVLWQRSGRKVDAQDVTFTLDLIRELGTSTRYSYVLDAVKAWSVGTDGSLILQTDVPDYSMLYALNFPILPRDTGYSASSAPLLPVGSGPYEVTACVRDQSMSLVVNEHWWRKRPYIDNIEAKSFEDTAGATSSLLLKQLDVVQTNELTASQYRDTGYANLYEYLTREFEFIAFNSRSADLSDIRMRQAIAYALDKRELISYVYVNHAIVADTPILPNSWLQRSKGLLYDTDRQRSRSLIKQCSWQDADGDGIWDKSPEGLNRKLSLTIIANADENSPLRRDSAEILASQLKQVGIQAEVKALPWEEYQLALTNGTFDLALCGVSLSSVPDLRFLLRSNGNMNFGKWQNQELDRALDAMMTTANNDEFKARCDTVQNILEQSLPILGLCFRTHTLLSAYDVQVTGDVQEENAYATIDQWYLNR